MKTIKGLTAAILLSSPVITFADDETIIVTANRLEQNVQDALTDIAIIEREDIERLQPQSFTDLLVNVAGLDITQKGGPGQDASIFSRGTNSNQLLILIDGVRVGSATLGGKSIATIAISQIERLEIVKGPRAALWGSDAIGGVIQIFTRRYQSGEHRIALTAGSNSTRDIDASAGFGSETFSNTITYSHKKTDGFDAHIDDEMSNVNISTNWYTWVMNLIMGLAAKHTDGKLVSVLEGGYCLKQLPELAKNHVEVLLNHS